MCSSRLESDDLLRYRMIEEPGRALGAFPGDKIEDRSACVSNPRGVATSRRLPLYSMRRKPVWGGPSAFTCGCARPMRSSGPTTLEREQRDLRLADAAWWLERMDESIAARLDAYSGQVNAPRPTAFPRSTSAIRFTPSSLPRNFPGHLAGYSLATPRRRSEPSQANRPTVRRTREGGPDVGDKDRSASST
jgi:hypothetical protein